MGTSSPPTPADPNQVAQTQSGYNTTAAEQNYVGSGVNQNNPYGSLNYSISGTGPGGIPILSASTNLSPQQQQLLSTLTGTQSTAGQQGQNLIQNANYGATDPTTAIGTGTSGISGQMMGGYMGLMQPFFTNQTQQLQTQLLNQGLTPSPTSNPSDPSTWGPYERAMYQNQTTQAQQVGAAAAQFQPQAEQEATSLYELPAQLGTSLSQFAAPTTPNQSFVSTPQFSTAAPNYEGDVATQQAMLSSNYQQQALQNSALMSGLFGLGGNVLGGMAKAGNLTFPALGGIGGAGDAGGKS